MRFGIGNFRTEAWFGEEILPSFELARIADEKGIDMLNFPEHVVMGKDISAYPYAGGLFTAETDFYEPIVQIAALATMTKRIRFVTSILMPNLRPAILLAKQIASLDVISNGRTEFGVGVGWQKFEYDAMGIPWEGRFGLMIETIQACRALWSACPASFHGKHINFDEAYSKPLPLQPGGPPIIFGVAPTDLNIERMARHADGWAPLNFPLDVVESATNRIKARMKELGRDPSKFSLRLNPEPVMAGDRIDVDATLATLDKLQAIGCTDVDFLTYFYCAGPDHYEAYLDKLIAKRDELNAKAGG